MQGIPPILVQYYRTIPVLGVTEDDDSEAVEFAICHIIHWHPDNVGLLVLLCLGRHDTNENEMRRPKYDSWCVDVAAVRTPATLDIDIFGQNSTLSCLHNQIKSF